MLWTFRQEQVTLTEGSVPESGWQAWVGGPRLMTRIRDHPPGPSFPLALPWPPEHTASRGLLPVRHWAHYGVQGGLLRPSMMCLRCLCPTPASEVFGFIFFSKSFSSFAEVLLTYHTVHPFAFHAVTTVNFSNFSNCKSNHCHYR